MGGGGGETGGGCAPGGAGQGGGGGRGGRGGTLHNTNSNTMRLRTQQNVQCWIMKNQTCCILVLDHSNETF